MRSRTASWQDPLAVCVFFSLGLHSLIVGSAFLRHQPSAEDYPVTVTYVIEPTRTPASVPAELEFKNDASEKRVDAPRIEPLKQRAHQPLRQRPPRSGQHANSPPHSASQELPPPRTPTGSDAGHDQKLIYAYADTVWRHLAAAARTYSPPAAYEVAPDGITTEVQLQIDADGQLLGVAYTEEGMLLTRQDTNFRRFLNSANPYPVPPGRRPAAVRVRLQIADLPG